MTENKDNKSSLILYATPVSANTHSHFHFTHSQKHGFTNTAFSLLYLSLQFSSSDPFTFRRSDGPDLHHPSGLSIQAVRFPHPLPLVRVRVRRPAPNPPHVRHRLPWLLRLSHAKRSRYDRQKPLSPRRVRGPPSRASYHSVSSVSWPQKPARSLVRFGLRL